MFTKASRNRLIDLFSKIVFKDRPVLITLTYPRVFPCPDRAKEHLDAFLKRMKRRCPRSSGVWRMELQKRGAPHFHLIMFHLPFIPKGEIQAMWEAVISSDIVWNKEIGLFTRIEAIRTARGVMFYASKYLAKSGGLNNDAYLTAVGEYVHPVTLETCWVGRWWGVFNRTDLPVGEEWTMLVEIDDTPFLIFRCKAAEVFQKINEYRWRGFTLYVENAEDWLNLWLDLLIAS